MRDRRILMTFLGTAVLLGLFAFKAFGTEAGVGDVEYTLFVGGLFALTPFAASPRRCFRRCSET